MIEIIDYADEHWNDFRSLNLQWLDAYELTETHDLEIINQPREKIINPGGYIYLAREDGQIVGTAGLAKAGMNVFELVKMSVKPTHRGRGISKLLIEKCLEKARDLKAERIVLFSNSRLEAALSLYRQYGFNHVEVTGTPLKTADVKMELKLSS